MSTFLPIDTKALPDFTEDNLTIQPIERSETIPSSWYTDPRFHNVDKEYIFEIGRASCRERV